MENDSEGWEIQEYSPSGGDGKMMTTTTRMRIVKRGLRIGKTIIVTGIVLSSAPFVLPPLMVVSAVGLACAFPFGVFVASYACTEKLMSKLLHMPRPPPPLPLMLEYKGFSHEDEVSYIDFESEEEIFEDEVEFEENGAEDKLMGDTEADLESMIPLQMSEDVEIKGGLDMEEEEERFIEDTKATVEMRIALPAGEDTEIVPEEKYYDGKAHAEEQKVEQGYQEDDENRTQEEQPTAVSEIEISASEIHPLVEVLRQERPVDNVNIDDPNLGQKTSEDITCSVIEVEGPYGLTIGAVEQTTVRKEAGDADQGEQSVMVDLEGSSEDKRATYGTQKDNGDQFAAEPRSIKVNEVHKTGVEGRTEISDVLETSVYTPSERITRKPEYELAETKDKKAKLNLDVTPINVEFFGVSQNLQKQNLDDHHVAGEAVSTTKRKKKSKKKKPTSRETSTVGTILDIHPAERDGTISSNADTSNIPDESNLNLVLDRNTAGEEIDSNKNAAGIVHPNESASTSRTPSGRSLRASPNKTLFSEEKIWENIEALRTIVGYKVARHQTCMEELKALYIFTGVEPPMSFKSSPDVGDAPDIVKVNELLRFLMAIVGVK